MNQNCLKLRHVQRHARKAARSEPEGDLIPNARLKRKRAERDLIPDLGGVRMIARKKKVEKIGKKNLKAEALGVERCE